MKGAGGSGLLLVLPASGPPAAALASRRTAHLCDAARWEGTVDMACETGHACGDGGWAGDLCVCVCVATLQEIRPPDQQGPREVTVVVALMICCHGQSSCLPRHSQSPDQIAACPTPPLLRARPCDRSPGSLKVAQYLTWSPNARKQAAV